MTRKNKRDDSSSSSEDDDDEEDDDEEDGSDEDSSGSDNQMKKSKKKKKKKSSKENGVQRRSEKKKPTINYQGSPNGVRSAKKHVTILEGGRPDERTDERADDFNLGTKRSNLKKVTGIYHPKQVEDLDDYYSDSQQQTRQAMPTSMKRRSQSKTVIATSNLHKLQNSALMVEKQNLVIFDLSKKLEENRKVAEVSLTVEQQKNGQKAKEIESISTEKTKLERKMGRQTTYLKRLKNQLKINRGQNFQLGIEKLNILGKQEQTETHSAVKYDDDIDDNETSNIYYLRVLNWLQYHYPFSNFVHKITNFYTKNEELHFTLLAVYANLATLAFIFSLPFVVKQLSSSSVADSSTSLTTKLMVHQFDPSIIDLALLNVLCFILVNTVVIFYKVSYVRQKKVEIEAHSQKDLTNFKLIFASVNYRLKTYQFTQKQQISIIDRIQLTQKLTPMFEKKRESVGQWVYLIRIILWALQVLFLLASMWLLHKCYHTLELSNPIMFKIPMKLGIISVLLSSTASQIPIWLTQFELYRTHLKSNKVRVWKGYVFNSIVLFYAMLLASPVQNFDFVGIDPNYQLVTTDFNCPSEQAVYSLLSIYFASIFYNIIELFLPGYISRIRFRGRNSSLKKSLSPFKVMESTYPICISNMLCNAIFPSFPLIGLIHALLMFVTFILNWQIVIRLKYQHFSSVSRSFLMGTLLNFYVISFVLSVTYFSIMSYQNQSTYFVGGDYTSTTNQRVCGPLEFGETFADRISDKLESLPFISGALRVLSWGPLLWMAIIYFFSLSRLELKTKRVWRSQFFQKIKEIEVIKSYYQTMINGFEKKIQLANNELNSINDGNDTPRASSNSHDNSHDFAPILPGAKSKFANSVNGSPTLSAQKAGTNASESGYSPLLNNSRGIGNFTSFVDPVGVFSLNFPTHSDEIKPQEIQLKRQAHNMFNIKNRSNNNNNKHS